MNKIIIHITPEKLGILLNAFTYFTEKVENEPYKRATRAIFEEVYTKLLKKQIDKRNETPNTVFKVKLKYYEAFALREVIGALYENLHVSNVYELNTCRMVFNEIDKQL